MRALPASVSRMQAAGRTRRRGRGWAIQQLDVHSFWHVCWRPPRRPVLVIVSEGLAGCAVERCRCRRLLLIAVGVELLHALHSCTAGGRPRHAWGSVGGRAGSLPSTAVCTDGRPNCSASCSDVHALGELLAHTQAGLGGSSSQHACTCVHVHVPHSRPVGRPQLLIPKASAEWVTTACSAVR